MVATLSFSFAIAATLEQFALLLYERQCVDRWMDGDDFGFQQPSASVPLPSTGDDEGMQPLTLQRHSMH
ncbi:hypothetical protein BLNAU_20118 [Blattamonas nauphoetae]|uniref:Secreted protein n=1 Tax=Blattamonas nauphoetae TaxID=2049346 RepID=A0ABQ9WZJ3_9EUKA|nr:hypothetical protein BLNAU_20118 [Blattamonas nauphoetae]